MAIAIRLSLCATLLVCGSASALAQAGGGAAGEDRGSFLGDTFGGIFGGGEPSAPGAYVSPSARDLVPDDSEVGVPVVRTMRRLEPIPLPPETGGGGSMLDLPTLPAYAPNNLPSLDIFRPKPVLTLEARLAADGEAIPIGLEWRLFSALPAPDGQLPLVAAASGGEASFEVPEGSYIVHLAFGRAGLTKRVRFEGLSRRETLVLEAGGLALSAVTGGSPIDPQHLDFDVYTVAADEADGDLVASDVPADAVVRLNAGTYRIVSHYGSINATVRADVLVEAGKITEATLQHRAAELTTKLVREAGGEAMADTAWTVSTASGDVVRESVGAFASMVLAEGEYEIVATNRDRVYHRGFTVEAGSDIDMEVTPADLVSELGPAAEGAPASGSGD